MDLENRPPDAAPPEGAGRARRSSGGAAAPTLAQALEQGVGAREAKRLALGLSRVLAERHSRGLVHGELTPRCVILTAKGGVAIEPAVDPGPALYRLRYAAPETARREDPTWAADVFALSLIVRELIEGLPARRSEGESLAHEAIDGRVSVPHGLERELHGLAALAASPHPENRPAASEFVAALKGMTQRRGLTGTEWAVAGLAVVALVLLVQMLRSNARDSERSIRQLNGSREAAATMFTGTFGAIDRIADLEPLADAGASALDALDEAREGGSPTEADDLLYAKALAWNGAVQERLGNDARATDQLRAAIDIEERLPAGSLGIGVQLEVRMALARLAENRGDPDVRERRLAEVLQRGRPLIGDADADPAVGLMVATALLDLADVARSSGDGGAPRVQDALDEARAILGHGTGSPALERRRTELRARLAGALADASEARGETEEAMDHIRERAALARALVALDPRNPAAREAAAKASVDFADGHRRMGRYPDAVTHFRDAVATWTRLVEMEPGHAPWRLFRARAMGSLAYCLDRVGEWQEAAAVREPAIAELRDLMEARVPGFQRTDLAKLLVESAEGFLAAGELQRARGSLVAAKGLLEQRLDRPEPWKDVGLVRISACLAEMFLAKGEWQKAETSALNVIDAFQAYLNRGDGGRFQSERVRALFVTAAVKIIRGEVEDATRVRERALGIAQALDRDPETEVMARSLEARALFLLGRDDECREVLEALEARGYRGLELNAARAAALADR